MSLNETSNVPPSVASSETSNVSSSVASSETLNVASSETLNVVSSVSSSETLNVASSVASSETLNVASSETLNVVSSVSSSETLNVASSVASSETLNVASSETLNVASSVSSSETLNVASSVSSSETLNVESSVASNVPTNEASNVVSNVVADVLLPNEPTNVRFFEATVETIMGITFIHPLASTYEDLASTLIREIESFVHYEQIARAILSKLKDEFDSVVPEDIFLVNLRMHGFLRAASNEEELTQLHYLLDNAKWFVHFAINLVLINAVLEDNLILVGENNIYMYSDSTANLSLELPLGASTNERYTIYRIREQDEERRRRQRNREGIRNQDLAHVREERARESLRDSQNERRIRLGQTLRGARITDSTVINEKAAEIKHMFSINADTLIHSLCRNTPYLSAE